MADRVDTAALAEQIAQLLSADQQTREGRARAVERTGKDGGWRLADAEGANERLHPWAPDVPADVAEDALRSRRLDDSASFELLDGGPADACVGRMGASRSRARARPTADA